MTDVVDLLVAAGARIDSLEMAAAAGDTTGWPLARHPLQDRLRALVFAADHQRLDTIDQLIDAGAPVNQADADWGRLPLHTARSTAGPPASGRCSPAAPTQTSAASRPDYPEIGQSPAKIVQINGEDSVTAEAREVEEETGWRPRKPEFVMSCQPLIGNGGGQGLAALFERAS